MLSIGRLWCAVPVPVDVSVHWRDQILVHIMLLAPRQRLVTLRVVAAEVEALGIALLPDS